MSHIELDKVTISYRDDLGVDAIAVRDASLRLERGERLGIVGESGSGKSTLARILLGHLRPGGRLSGGSVQVAGRDVMALSAGDLMRFRGGRVAMVPQNPLSSLTSHLRIGDQLGELVRRHTEKRGAAARDHMLAIMERTGLPTPDLLARRYPHELSGGQRQRVVIAAALIGDPEVIVLDEPTTALDKTVEARVLSLVGEIQRAQNATLIYVSHDLNVVRSVCDRVAVMKDGQIVEAGPISHVFHAPAQEYTRRLVAAIPKIDVSGPVPPTGGEPGHLLARGVSFSYQRPHRWFGGKGPRPLALENVCLSLGRGETLGIVGESGSGKSTLASLFAGLLSGNDGELTLGDDTIQGLARTRTKQDRRRIQLVFQDPLSALNPTQTVGEILSRPLRLYRGMTAAAAREEAVKLLKEMELVPALLDRRPRQLSGGQQQRVGFARALAAAPDLLICDEVTSALDVTVQARVLDLFQKVQRERGMTCLFISHDLGTIARVSHHVAVMKGGRVVEFGPRDSVLCHPESEYTAQLLNAHEPDVQTGPLKPRRSLKPTLMPEMAETA